MRPTYLITLALALLAISAGVYAADYYYAPAQNCYQCQSCGSCYNPAYDRTPICVQADTSVCCGPCGAGPCVAPVDPWDKCGAFCYGGQLAPGWPYGWNSEYWLRPNSNF